MPTGTVRRAGGHRHRSLERDRSRTSALLSRQGMRVVLASRSRVALEEAQRECRGAPTLVVPTDVSSTAEVEALFEAALAAYGRVDAVVHSAAALAYGRFEDVPDEIFEHAIEVTLSGTARRRPRGPAALRDPGRWPARRRRVAAGQDRHAVHELLRDRQMGRTRLGPLLQIEARETPGIHVSLVSPGGVNTPVYLQAGTYVGLHGRPPPPVVSPERGTGHRPTASDDRLGTATSARRTR